VVSGTSILQGNSQSGQSFIHDFDTGVWVSFGGGGGSLENMTPRSAIASSTLSGVITSTSIGVGNVAFTMQSNPTTAGFVAGDVVLISGIVATPPPGGGGDIFNGFNYVNSVSSTQISIIPSSDPTGWTITKGTGILYFASNANMDPPLQQYIGFTGTNTLISGLEVNISGVIPNLG